MKRWGGLLILMLVVTGCGYTPRGLSPGIGVKTLFIQPLKNRTAEPFLDSLVTNSLVEWFGRDSRLRLVADAKDAEAVLSGEITSYSRRSVSYNRLDKIREYRSDMRVNANLRRVADGKILWKDSVSWSEESLNSSNRAQQDDNETEAIRKISNRLGEQIYNRMQENF